MFLVKVTRMTNIGHLDIDHLSHLDQKHLLANVDQSWPTLTNCLTNFDQGFVKSVRYCCDPLSVLNFPSDKCVTFVSLCKFFDGRWPECGSQAVFVEDPASLVMTIYYRLEYMRHNYGYNVFPGNSIRSKQLCCNTKVWDMLSYCTLSQCICWERCHSVFAGNSQLDQNSFAATQKYETCCHNVFAGNSIRSKQLCCNTKVWDMLS